MCSRVSVCTCLLQGTLRDQLLYPRLLGQLWKDGGLGADIPNPSEPLNSEHTPLMGGPAEDTGPADDHLRVPSDEELTHILHALHLSHLLQMGARHPEGDGVAVPVDGCTGLDWACDWPQVLSVGEQQRLAFARLLCHK